MHASGSQAAPSAAHVFPGIVGVAASDFSTSVCLSVRLFLLLFVCLSVPAPATVCLLAQKICYRPLGSYTLRRSQTAHSNLSRSPAVLDSSSHLSMFPCVCESDCVLVGVLCSVLFASVSLTLSFIICTTNSWALQEDNLYLMRFSYVWGLGNLAESSIR